MDSSRIRPDNSPVSSGVADKTILLVSAAVVLLSFVLTVHGERDVVVPGIRFTLPGLCMSQRILGMPCPGCGLTRSFISLAHGDWLSAWRYNAVGILFFVLVAAQIPYRFRQLYRRNRGLPTYEMGAWSVAPLAVIAGLLFVQWAIKMSAQYM